MNVLSGTDFSKVQVDVILVETNRRGIQGANKEEILDFLTKLGMILILSCDNHHHNAFLFAQVTCVTLWLAIMHVIAVDSLHRNVTAENSSLFLRPSKMKLLLIELGTFHCSYDHARWPFQAFFLYIYYLIYQK